jgi:hypothetical protein
VRGNYGGQPGDQEKGQYDQTPDQSQFVSDYGSKELAETHKFPVERLIADQKSGKRV